MASPKPQRSILFVCTGNICRSPTAEAVARQMIKTHGQENHIRVDSAGTHNYHVGDSPDKRSIAAAAKRGYDMTNLRARQLNQEDFIQFDLLVAMDITHLHSMNRLCPPALAPKISLLMRYATQHDDEEIVDPYYGNEADFEKVLDYCEDAISGLLNRILIEQP